MMATLAANGQNTTQTQPQKSKVYYSFAWGLFKSENYQNNKAAKLEIQKPAVLVKSNIDSKEYEVKSILWGAIKWTEKKEK